MGGGRQAALVLNTVPWFVARRCLGGIVVRRLCVARREGNQQESVNDMPREREGGGRGGTDRKKDRHRWTDRDRHVDM